MDTKVSGYINSKIDNKEYCKTNGQFTRHLRNNNLTYQEYYEKHITGVKEICPHCRKSKTFYQKNYTYGKTCGNEICIGKEISNTKSTWTEEQKLIDSKNKKSAAETRTEKEIEDILTKRKNTNLKKYGVEHSTQSENNKVKSKKTKLEKYGNEYYSNWMDSADKNRNKTEEEQDKINNKRRKTNKKLFGVENVFLRPDVISKSRKGNSKGKEYILPSGKIIGIRGYENIALDKLFKIGYKEDDLIIHNKLEEYKLPIFDYISNERQHLKYYPDIYIPKENLIIEIKALWWWNGYGKEKYKGRLINNQRKKESVINLGYNYQVWLYKPDKKDFEII